MSAPQIQALFGRLMALSDRDFKSAVWQTFGGLKYLALNKPHARVSEVLEVLAARVADAEKRLAMPPPSNADVLSPSDTTPRL